MAIPTKFSLDAQVVSINHYLAERCLFHGVQNEASIWELLKIWQNENDGQRVVSKELILGAIIFRYNRKDSNSRTNEILRRMIEEGFISEVGNNKYMITDRGEIVVKYCKQLESTGGIPQWASDYPINNLIGGFFPIRNMYTKFAAERNTEYLRSQETIGKQTGVKTQSTISRRLSKAGAAVSHNYEVVVTTRPFKTKKEAYKEADSLVRGLGTFNFGHIYAKFKYSDEGYQAEVIKQLPNAYNLTGGPIRVKRAWNRSVNKRLAGTNSRFGSDSADFTPNPLARKRKAAKNLNRVQPFSPSYTLLDADVIRAHPLRTFSLYKRV